jgi:formylglycine-generating enzyme required for sulfatase activity
MSLTEAQAFCKWLSERTGLTVRLPSEAEWEYACRAGSATPMHYGGLDADFSAHENLADRALIEQGFFFHVAPLDKRRSGMRYMATPFALDARYNDGIAAPSGTGELKPNAWGLYDMHGNVQEWTTSLYDPQAQGGDPKARRVVRGGSWMDRPSDARCGIRRGYEPWRRVHNVGFRIVVEIPEAHAAAE